MEKVLEGISTVGFPIVAIRLIDLPETYISNVLFTSIMQIAELGFSEKPTPNF